MRSKLTLLKRGLANPRQIPPYILGKLFPGSSWGSDVEYHDDYITFRPGGFVQGARNRPAFSAKLFYHATALNRAIEDFGQPVDTSLEIGCGYGRLTPWIASYADQSYAIDPNEGSLAEARAHYPTVKFESEVAHDLSFDDNQFDLIVSWTVLQHIPPDLIGDATSEIRRVLSSDGVIILVEQTASLDRENAWGRTEETYEQLLSPIELLDSRSKPVEPTLGVDCDAPSAVRGDTDLWAHPHERMMVLAP